MEGPLPCNTFYPHSSQCSRTRTYLNHTHPPGSAQGNSLKLFPSLLVPRSSHKDGSWTFQGSGNSFLKPLAFILGLPSKRSSCESVCHTASSILPSQAPSPTPHPPGILKSCRDSGSRKGALDTNQGKLWTSVLRKQMSRKYIFLQAGGWILVSYFQQYCRRISWSGEMVD